MDPVSGAVAKAAAEATTEAAKGAGNLIGRAFGPVVDVYAAHWKEKAEYRLRAKHIAERTYFKLADRPEEQQWPVNERVALRILQDGPLCDDEVMADYMSGLLASGRSPSGRDDRAVYWSHLVTSLSSLQVRLHYIYYREWAERLSGIDLNLGLGSHRSNALLIADLELVGGLLFAGRDDEDYSAGFAHAMYGLAARDLINPYAVEWGTTSRAETADVAGLPFETFVAVEPSGSGLELFGWAQGRSDVIASDFTSKARPFDIDPALPRLESVRFPRLAVLSGEDGAEP